MIMEMMIEMIMETIMDTIMRMIMKMIYFDVVKESWPDLISINPDLL